jgi:ribosomal protein S24E
VRKIYYPYKSALLFEKRYMISKTAIQYDDKIEHDSVLI